MQREAIAELVTRDMREQRGSARATPRAARRSQLDLELQMVTIFAQAVTLGDRRGGAGALRRGAYAHASEGGLELSDARYQRIARRCGPLLDHRSQLAIRDRAVEIRTSRTTTRSPRLVLRP